MKKRFWILLCLFNLALVAFLGFILRSKILFPLPMIDYGNLESAHSHFAFAGWVGLSLFTLFIFNLLPPEQARKKIYFVLLIAIEVSALGMAFSFPFFGYNAISISFSTLYIVANYIFAPVFLSDFFKSKPGRTLALLAAAGIGCLLLSAIGPLGLSYILATKSGNSILYRDAIYTFLHFQYNGFFTLSIFALLFNALKKVITIDKGNLYRFSFFLVLSVVPSLFLSMLWHNKVLFYVLAATGSVLILISLVFLLRSFKSLFQKTLLTSTLSRNFLMLSMVSFVLKMLLNTGTIFPYLGDAIYGNRPVIIGFLHLVFLGFVSFFLLSSFVQEGAFTRRQRLLSAPLYIFALGIIMNEALLMFQGLEILFQSNSTLYNWLLWVAAIVLFTGGITLAIAGYVARKDYAKAVKENAPQL